MNFIRGLLLSILLVTSAYAQSPGTVTNHAFAIGKGPNVAGYKSLLCASGSFPVGQVGADPICRTLSGDVTMSAAGVATLATVNANVGSFGSTTNCVSLTVNAKGLVTAASQATCAPAVSGLTGLGTGVATALAANVNATGGVVSPTPTRAGDVIYWNGSAWVTVAGNNSGTQFLQENASGVPSWATVAGTGTVTSVTCNGTVITTSGACPTSVVTVKKQTFTTNGTYTPSTGMLYAIIECMGPGGGGGGTANSTGASGAGSGGAGGYSKVLVTAAQVGASKTVTIGTGGAGGAAGPNAGAAGSGPTSVGSLCIANAGAGGGLSSPSAGTPGAGGAAGTGDIAAPGANGFPGYNSTTLTLIIGVFGGANTIWGAGGIGATSAGNGAAATGFGASGVGGSSLNSSGTAAGGNGAPGAVYITEYNSQ